MQNSKRLWRTLLFFMIIAALCGSFAFPVGITSVQAAPRMQAATNVVISEFRTRGPDPNGLTNEFIEIYNPTSNAVDVGNWEIRYSTSGGNTTVRYSFPAGKQLLSGQHFLLANSNGYSGSIAADATYTSGLANDGGIAIVDAAGNIIDQVGMSNGSLYKEPADGSGILTPLAANTDQSYDRNIDGAGICTDSNNNASDFFLRSPSDPQNSSSPLTTCGNPTPTPTPTSTSTDTPTPTSTATATNTPTATGTPTSTSTSSSALSVVINEVAWSGTVANTDDEWIELYNPGTLPVDITGWHLYGDDNTLNKTGSPNISLKGTIPAGGYFLLEKNEQATTAPADQVYSSGDLLNSGERLYLKDSSGTVIDTANLDGGAWPAGTASVTTTSPPPYASMERVGTTSQWVTYGGTVPVAYDRNGGPIKGTPGSGNWINSITITTITSDLPDPSLVNQNVTVAVSVIGGRTIPTGKVNITGANTNCSITLSNGTGSCVVKFTTIGTKTLIATYVGDATHPASSDTESHQVSTSVVRTPTLVPTPLPPPPLIAINEFVPRPGHDWNGDGVVNVKDEYIELLNHGTVNVNLSGYSLDDEVNVGSTPYRLPAVTLRPGERYVFYGSETGLLLGDGGDGVRLLKPNGQLGDAYNYSVVGYPDQSFCRLPDNGGADDWSTNCFPTPGLQNSLNAVGANPSTNTGKELYCPIADTLPSAFAQAECEPFGSNIWNSEFWDHTGWYGEKYLPWLKGRWSVFAN